MFVDAQPATLETETDCDGRKEKKKKITKTSSPHGSISSPHLQRLSPRTRPSCISVGGAVFFGCVGCVSFFSSLWHFSLFLCFCLPSSPCRCRLHGCICLLALYLLFQTSFVYFALSTFPSTDPLGRLDGQTVDTAGRLFAPLPSTDIH